MLRAPPHRLAGLLLLPCLLLAGCILPAWEDREWAEPGDGDYTGVIEGSVSLGGEPMTCSGEGNIAVLDHQTEDGHLDCWFHAPLPFGSLESLTVTDFEATSVPGEGPAALQLEFSESFVVSEPVQINVVLDWAEPGGLQIEANRTLDDIFNSVVEISGELY